jgi:hypothetical protein
MPTPEKYNRFAVRCLDEARRTTDQSLRAFLIEMAQAWQMLANHANTSGKIERQTSRESDPGD